jgi:hypothetical protein
MTRSSLCLVIPLLLSVLHAPGATEEGGPRKVSVPPEELSLDPFYAKYVAVDGYPIVGSAKVDDLALLEAAWLVEHMFRHKEGLAAAMTASGSRLIVMDHTEFTSDIPEYHWLEPAEFWDRRARGLGGSSTDPVASCAEENLLGYPGDPYSTESITIHEFAHNIHLRGMARLEPDFDDKVKAAFDAAIEAGKWEGKYAATNHHEYWAEAVQSWFDTNREPDHDHNHVNTRAELREYDSAVAALCEHVFGDGDWRYTRPETRLEGHLRDYDPKTAPRFEWPERLRDVKIER